jgi:hypothetical protein
MLIEFSNLYNVLAPLLARQYTEYGVRPRRVQTAVSLRSAS